MQEYLTHLEHLDNRIERSSEKALVGCFVGGLNDEIIADIKMFKFAKHFSGDYARSNAGRNIEAHTPDGTTPTSFTITSASTTHMATSYIAYSSTHLT